MTHQSIEKNINDLKEGSSNEEMNALNELHQQFFAAGNASRSKEELQEWLKSDNDVLDGFEQDTEFYENVRSIQDSIINFFAE